MKSRDRKSQRRQEKRRKRKSKKRKSQKKEDADARKGRKVAKHCVFPMICGSGGSKSRLAKAAGAEPSGQMRDKKLHAVVAPSTFPSQNVHNTPCSDRFWKLTCRKSARRCGARSTFRSQNVKRTRGLNHFWTFRCRFAWQVQGIVHLVKRGFCTSFSYNHRYTTLHYTPLQTQNYNYNYITLHYATLH